MSWRQQLDATIDSLTDEIVALRRHLHAHPELSGAEHETSLHLYQLLSDTGLSVRMGPEGRGLLVDSGGGGDSVERFAIRADIDALPIQDEKTCDYRSQTPGVMHACGHDSHTACAFGAAVALDRLAKANKLPSGVAWRAIFQPAEETATGAAEMVAAGALDGVAAAVALHADPSRSAGVIGVRSGVLTAFAEMMRIEVHGAGGHAARPHESHDPIAAAAQLIGALYQFIPRRSDSQDAIVVTIGQVAAGENANVIPEHALLRGTIRTLDPNVRERTLQHVRELADGVAQVTGTKITVDFEVSLPSVDNDAALTEMVRREATELLGPSGVELLSRPSMGSEDFAVFGQHVPLTMFRLGVARPERTPAPALHTPLFDIDESALLIGAKLLARSAVAWHEA